MFYKRIFLTVGFSIAAMAASAQFVINEIDSDTPGTDTREFVEIKGPASTSLAGKVLVFFGSGTGNNKSTNAIDLTGSTDANGFYLVGNPAVPGCDQTFTIPMQNGEDAVALYTGAASSFPTGTAPTAGAIDYVIYENGADTNRTWTGFGGSTTVYNESLYLLGTFRSLQRIPDTTGAWEPSTPTPRAANAALANQVVNFDPVSADFGNFNVNTTVGPTTLTVHLENYGKGSMNVTAFGLSGSSNPVFTQIQGPDPALPVTLTTNQSTSVVLQFTNAATAANAIFNGALDYTTDAPVAGTGSLPVTAQFVKVTQTASAGAVVVNEVSYNNPNFDYNNDGYMTNQDDEFIELYNTTGSPITIEGWEIKIIQAPVNGTTAHSYVFPAGATIGANGFVVMFSQGTPTGFAPGTAFARSTWQALIFNPGSLIEINDGTTRIDGIAYGDGEDSPDADGYTNTGVIITGGSIGRHSDGSSPFRTFDSAEVFPNNRPSPGATNNPPTAAQDWMLFQ